MSEQEGAPLSGSAPSRVDHRVIFWSGLLSALLALVFDLAAGLGGGAGGPTRLVATGAPLLLALTFVVLVSAIHASATSGKRVWTQIALSFAIMYGALLASNYFVQLSVVRVNPRLYALLSMEFTSRSAFWSLETIGYTMMALSGLFLVPVFDRGGLERIIRWAFMVNAALTVIAAVAYAVTVNPVHILVLVNLGVWAIAVPLATALIAVVHRREEGMQVAQ